MSAVLTSSIRTSGGQRRVLASASVTGPNDGLCRGPTRQRGATVGAQVPTGARVVVTALGARDGFIRSSGSICMLQW